MSKSKISKEEKAFIKAYIKLLNVKYNGELDEKDAEWIEYEVTGIIENRNMEYRYTVEDYISKLINELNK